MRLRRRRVCRGSAIVAVVAGVAVGLCGGSAAASDDHTAGSGMAYAATSAGPYQIAAASLTQDGQNLVWHVQLGEPWGADRLARQGRSLCLLIERVATGAVWGQACVAGPAHHSGGPSLEYRPVNGTTTGPEQLVPANVSRPSSSELTASFLPSAVDLHYGTIRWQTISTLSSSGCASSGIASRTCSNFSPSKPALLRMHTPVLVGCVAHGPSLVSQGSSRLREIALTFDDGPWPDPPSIDFVRLLDREHVPASFFEIGDQISTYDPTGSVERQMIADGDMIGDHTWTHPLMTRLSRSAQRSQLVRTIDAIQHATGFTPCLWRAPYGAINASLISLARSLGMLTVMWNVDPRDWSLPGARAIYSNVVANARNGAIVELHFGGGPRYETLDALPQMIATLRARGYRFVTVAQLLGLKMVYR